MTTNIINELHKDRLRGGLNKYTRKAFQMLPELENPKILDIGCGTGVPTMELARLSNGQITGLDISQPLLDELIRKIEAAGLSDGVKTVKCSLFELDFPDESFDLIWAEGAIFVIGFERGLNEWRRLLKPKGFLVVHDEIANMTKKLKQTPRCGYELLGYFTVTEDTWWREYYGPLEKRIRELRKKYSDDPEAIAVLEKEQREVDMFKRNPKRFGSVFFVMQKC
ncbi:MAG: class I SAM-dependent methyltransferase [Halobacteriota archaeon]